MLFQEIYLQILSVFSIPKSGIIGEMIAQIVLITVCHDPFRDITLLTLHRGLILKSLKKITNSINLSPAIELGSPNTFSKRIGIGYYHNKIFSQEQIPEGIFGSEFLNPKSWTYKDRCPYEFSYFLQCSVFLRKFCWREADRSWQNTCIASSSRFF